MIKKMSFETRWAGILGIIAIAATITELFVSGITALTVIGAIKDIAETLVVVMVFFATIKHILKSSDKRIDKLNYLEFVEKNKTEILKSKDVSVYAKEILYGMTVLIHSGEIDELHNRIKNTLKNSTKLSTETRATLSCILAMLDVFIATARLKLPLSEDKFKEIMPKLEIAYEKDIKDTDLAVWCKILRNDKQQLCFEKYSDSLIGEEKIKYLNEAIDKCNECNKLLNDLEKDNPIDANYVLLYRALTYRNLSQLYKKLSDEEKAKSYCEKTLEARQNLFGHYKSERNSNGITMDYITQEYILALAEQRNFAESADKEKLTLEINELFDVLKDKHKFQNSIIDKINEEINKSV